MDPRPSPWARLVGLKDRLRSSFPTTPNSDRHGIVTRTAGVDEPNHYLAVSHTLLLPRHLAGDAAGRQTLVQQQHDIDRSCEAWAAG